MRACENCSELEASGLITVQTSALTRYLPGTGVRVSLKPVVPTAAKTTLKSAAGLMEELVQLKLWKVVCVKPVKSMASEKLYRNSREAPAETSWLVIVRLTQ